MVKLPQKELVFGKLLAKDVCLRVYTSITKDGCAEKGSDAIRVALVKRLPDKRIIGIGKAKRVHRIETWRKNLQERIDMFEARYKEAA